MKEIRIFVLGLAALALLITGCASAGRLTEADYTWSTEEVDVSWTELNRSLTQGLRGCYRSVLGTTSECYVDPEKREVLCDLYQNSVLGSPQFAMGQIRIQAIDDQRSKVYAGLRHWLDSDKRREYWLSLTKGEIICYTRLM